MEMSGLLTIKFFKSKQMIEGKLPNKSELPKISNEKLIGFLETAVKDCNNLLACLNQILDMTITDRVFSREVVRNVIKHTLAQIK